MNQAHAALSPVTLGWLPATIGVLALIGVMTVFGKAFDAVAWLVNWYTTRGARAHAAAAYELARRMFLQNSLAEYEAGVDYGTDLWRQLRREAVRAEKGVSPLSRWVIGQRVERELDYNRRISKPAGAGADLATGPRQPRQPSSPGGQR